MWKVPENSLLDVERLPRTLKAMGLAEKYVGFDLPCITQDRDNADLAPIAQVELARQADTFRNASTAVVWFTDIRNWTDAEANVAGLALVYLQDGIRAHGAGVRDKIAQAAAGLRGQVSRSSGFHPGTGDSSTQPPGWMSSLWTLQEISIRPDTVLMNRNLKLLTVGSNTALTYGLLVALFSRAYFDSDWRQDLTGHDNNGLGEDAYDASEKLSMDELDGNVDDLDAPQGVVDLAGVLLDPGSMDLIGADRLTPIVLGTMRKATASRGEAIMAATGAVDWHLGRSVQRFQSQAGAPEDLLSGLYPFVFVRELRDSCGAIFFTNQQDISTLICTRKGLIDPGYRGTMLPFMKDSPGALQKEAVAICTMSSRAQMFGIILQRATRGEWVLREVRNIPYYGVPADMGDLCRSSVDTGRLACTMMMVVGQGPLEKLSQYIERSLDSACGGQAFM